MKISVVTSLYFSANYINNLYESLVKTMAEITEDYEIIFVNDASPDNSLELALEIHKRNNSRLKIIDLSRNFGQHKALMTGLQHATGNIIFMMDSDLEEDPKEITRFYNLHKTELADADVIFGVQETRKGSLFEKMSGNFFYKVFNFLSPVKVKNNPTPFRLMTRRYVNTLIQFKEKELFFLGVSLLAGFKQVPVPIIKKNKRVSSYNIFKKINQSINALTSFTNTPLVLVFYLGAIVSFFSFLYLLSILYQYIVLSVGVQGWTSIIASIWFVGGLIILCIGVIGIYISKIFGEVKERPFSIIKHIYE